MLATIKQSLSKRKFFVKLGRLLGTLIAFSSLFLYSNEKKRGKLENFILEHKSHLARGSIKNCNHGVFHSYSVLHKNGKKSKRSKFLIYHVLDEDTVGLGCRISAAL